jgi:UDP-3-O-[3-hydroxymyristoyl] glucosamine N-acyltransferase
VAVAGSTSIGSFCTIGAGALILGHLTIADHVTISADTVISRSIRKPGKYTGLFPADAHDAWARNAAVLRHLAGLRDRVLALEKRIHGKEGSND